MANTGRLSLTLSVATLLSFASVYPAQAHLVEDFGVRTGEPVHISLSTGFNGFVGAGIKKIEVDGVQMDAFCIDPFTMALRSSPGYRFVPLTQAPEAPWTLTSHQAIEISDLWAMFYSPDMKPQKAAGLQLAIWEIVGGNHFSIIGENYHADRMLAALQGYTGPGANLIALTGPGQDYVVATPPGQGAEGTPTPTPTPHSTPPGPTPTPTPHSTPTPSPTPHTTPNPTPSSTPVPTMPPVSTPNPTPPLKSVPDSGSTFYLLGSAILALLAIDKFRRPLPALARVQTKR
jgi:VPDSG-CTERM motif